MILRELFYNDPNLVSVSNDLEYDPSRDKSSVKRRDTRKVRLTLRQINQLRKASDAHFLNQEKELEFIEKMYKMPEQPV